MGLHVKCFTLSLFDQKSDASTVVSQNLNVKIQWISIHLVGADLFHKNSKWTDYGRTDMTKLIVALDNCFMRVSKGEAFKIKVAVCMQEPRPWQQFFNACNPEVFNTYINVQWYVSQTQQNSIMFIIVLGQRVSILIESSSGPSKKIDPYVKCLKMRCGIQTLTFLDHTAHF